MTVFKQEDLYQITNTIASWLGETKETAKYQLSRIVDTLGKDRVFALLQKTLEVEAAGGLQTVKGTRRTIGGVFFILARESCTPEEVAVLWPPRVWKETRQRRKMKRQKARAMRIDA